MPETDDLTLLLDAAQKAGRIASKHFGANPEFYDKGNGLGPVSVADQEINSALYEMLTAARPDYGWLSEESVDDPARLDAAYSFILDPIDGTRAFLEQQPHFSHSIAIAKGAEIVAAVVHLPELGLTYRARKGGGAFLNGRRLGGPHPADLKNARILSNAQSLKDDHWRGGAPPVKRHFRPSLAYRLCLVADGSFDGMISMRPTWEWDIAAGTLIAGEAGVTVTDRTGAPPRFNQPDPRSNAVIAAPAPLHAALMDRL
ncbi:3'(2'),5'-bisphosphate nucleotidase CysQ [Paracoccaceae bacterium GXU_MW_L88]